MLLQSAAITCWYETTEIGKEILMKEIVIFGLGDAGKIAHFYFSRDSEYTVVAFAIDDEFFGESTFLGLPVVRSSQLKDTYPPDRYGMFVAVGYSQMNQVRASLYSKIKLMGYTCVNYISSKCTFLTEEKVGENLFILEDNTIQPFVQIGNNITMWSGNHIGHDAIIEDHCFITSHVVISGHVRVGAYSFIGVNATLRNNITIGERTLIGAGSIIMKNSRAGSVFVPERTAVFSKTSDQIDM